MKCKFSEAQFQFNILHEIVNKLSSDKGWNMPIIPSLAKENDLGYDCKLDSSFKVLFFQFKIPEKLTRKNAKYWSYFSGPYYKFKIWPDLLTPQHNKLIELANSDKRYNVFYCSPSFIDVDELQLFYHKKEIAKNSIFVPCKNLSKINGKDKHDICYTINPRKIVMHSDIYEVNGMDYNEFIMEISECQYSNSEEVIDNLSQILKIDINKNLSSPEQLRIIAENLLCEYNIQTLLFFDV